MPIIAPVPSWSADAKPETILTEVRKAFVDLASALTLPVFLGPFPTAASISIFNSGSNANGSYLQFADGTMIQRMTLTSGGGDQLPVTFPIPFATTSYSIITGAINSVFGVGTMYLSEERQYRTTLLTKFFCAVLSGVATVTFDIVAIGPWK